MVKKVPHFEMELQSPYANLCWAAVALSVDFWQVRRGEMSESCAWSSLCEVASAISGAVCCPDASSPECDQVATIREGLEPHDHYGNDKLMPDHRNPDPDGMNEVWTLIKEEIDADRVVCASIDWFRFGGHGVVIWGYTEDSVLGLRKVFVLDPLGLQECLPFDAFVTNFRDTGYCHQLTTIQAGGQS